MMAKRKQRFDPARYTSYADVARLGREFSAEGKAEFAERLVDFIGSDFARQKWTKTLYRRLCQAFGHIAHYDAETFFGTFFMDTEGKITFLRQMLGWPCYGDPQFTFSDVEHDVREYLRQQGILEKYMTRLADEQEAADRATYERLRAKYERVK